MYSSKLFIQIGKIKNEEEKLDPEIYGKDLGVGVPIPEEFEEYDTLNITRITHNNKIIYTSDTCDVLQFISFRQKIHPITFLPSIEIIKQLVYDTWDYVSFKRLKNDIKNLREDTYCILGLLSTSTQNIPDNFIFYIKKHLKSKCISCNIEEPISWILLLYKNRIQNHDSSNKQYVNSNVFSNNPHWSKMSDEIKQNLDIIKQPCNNTLSILKEDISENLATVNIDLKSVFYVLK